MPSELTGEQQLAADYLALTYGGVVVGQPAPDGIMTVFQFDIKPGTRQMIGLRGGDIETCKWLVAPDGTVGALYDPNNDACKFREWLPAQT